MSYVSLEEFKAYIRNEMPSADNSDLQEALEVADSMIANICGRSFTPAGEVEETRTFVPDPVTGVLRIHDATAVTSVVENGVTLVAGTDYQLEPIQNAWSGEPWPYEQIRRQSANWYTYLGTGTVVVTGTWGWPGVPAAVKQAEKILAKDVISHRDVKFGLVGITETGGVRARQASLVGEILAPYIRAGIGTGGVNGDSGGAFSIDTRAGCAVVHADVCSLYFGALYCSCGASLTLSYPLWEVCDTWR